MLGNIVVDTLKLLFRIMFFAFLFRPFSSSNIYIIWSDVLPDFVWSQLEQLTSKYHLALLERREFENSSLILKNENENLKKQLSTYQKWK